MAFSPASTSRDALQRLLDGLQTLIREHLALARFELKEDVRNMGRDLLVGASGVPALAAGYLLSMMAFGYLLAIWLPAWAAFGIVALVNLGAGSFLSFLWGRRAVQKRVQLRKTSEELKNDKEWLAALKSAPHTGGDGRIQASH